MTTKALGQISITDLTDGYTVSLSRDSGSFVADATYKALDSSTVFTVAIDVLQGKESVNNIKIGSCIVRDISGNLVSSGITAAPATGNVSPVTITVTGGTGAGVFTGQAATVTIPVYIKGDPSNPQPLTDIVINKIFTISAAPQGVGIQSTTFFYLLAPANALAPAKPTTNPPPTISETGYSGWSETEPIYTGTDAKKLYVTVRTVYSKSGPNNFEYTEPSQSSSYDVAAAAYALANSTALDTKYIWSNVGDDSYAKGTYAATAAINGVTFNRTDSSTYGFNSYLSAAALQFRYNAIPLTMMSNQGLQLYAPIVSGGAINSSILGAKLTSTALTFYENYNNTAKAIAEFGQDIKIGAWEDGTQSYLKLDYRSLKLFDKGNNAPAFFSIEDLRQKVGNDQIVTLTENFDINIDEFEDAQVLSIAGVDVIDKNGSHLLSNEAIINSSKAYRQEIIFQKNEVETGSTLQYESGDGETVEFTFDFNEKFLTSVVVDGITQVLNTDYIIEDGALIFNDEHIPTIGENNIVITYTYQYYSNNNIIENSILYNKVNNTYNEVDTDLYSIELKVDSLDDNYYYCVYFINNTVLLNTEYAIVFESNIYETAYPIKNCVEVTINNNVVTNYAIVNDKSGIVFTTQLVEDDDVKITYNIWAYQPDINILEIEPSDEYELIDEDIVFKIIPTNEDTYEIKYYVSPASFKLKFHVVSITEVLQNDIQVSSNYYSVDSNDTLTFTNDITLNTGDIITVEYTSDSTLLKAFTLGFRDNNYAIGGFSTTIGYNTAATENYSYAEGYLAISQGKQGAHAEGYNTHALGASSHTEGNSTETTGINAHAEGYDTIAGGRNSHAEGKSSEALEEGAHAEGYNTQALGSASHSEGYNTIARSTSSHSEGYGTIAQGAYSHAQNLNTIANGDSQTVIGKYNIADTSNLFIVGNGTSSKRSNAFSISSSGNLVHSGSLSVGTNIYLKNQCGIYLKGTNGTNYLGLYIANTNNIGLGTTVTNTYIASKTTSNNGGYILTSSGTFYPGGGVRLKNGVSISGYKKGSTKTYYTIGYVSSNTSTGYTNAVIIGDNNTNLVLRGKNHNSATTYILNADGFLSLKSGIRTGGSIWIPNGNSLYSYKTNNTTTITIGVVSASNNIILSDDASGTHTVIKGTNHYTGDSYILSTSGFLSIADGIHAGGSITIPNNYAFNGRTTGGAQRVIGAVSTNNNVILGDDATRTVIRGTNGNSSKIILSELGNLYLDGAITTGGRVTTGAAVVIPNNSAFIALGTGGGEHTVAAISNSNNVLIGNNDGMSLVLRGNNHCSGDDYILSASGFLSIGGGIHANGSITIPNNSYIIGKGTGGGTHSILGINTSNYTVVGNSNLRLHLSGSSYSFTSAANFRHALSIGSDISIQSKVISVGTVDASDYKYGEIAFTYSSGGHSYNGRCIVGWTIGGIGASYLIPYGLYYNQSENKIRWYVRNSRATAATEITLTVFVLFTY